MNAKTFCFDLDGTLCTNTNGEYDKALPIQNRIKIVNRLYREGHKIIIESARGSTTKTDWYDLTHRQLREWNINHHLLRVGVKIEADVYVDDKAAMAGTFFARHK